MVLDNMTVLGESRLGDSALGEPQLSPLYLSERETILFVLVEQE